MKATLGIRADEALVANLYAADRSARRDFRSAVTRHAGETERVAKRDCPVKSGFAREHIRSVFTPDGLISETGWFDEDFAVAGLDFYPPFFVFGTRFMAPNDPLYPAALETQPDFEREISEIARSAIRRLLVRRGAR